MSRRFANAAPRPPSVQQLAHPAPYPRCHVRIWTAVTPLTRAQPATAAPARVAPDDVAFLTRLATRLHFGARVARRWQNAFHGRQPPPPQSAPATSVTAAAFPSRQPPADDDHHAAATALAAAPILPSAAAVRPARPLRGGRRLLQAADAGHLQQRDRRRRWRRPRLHADLWQRGRRQRVAADRSLGHSRNRVRRVDVSKRHRRDRDCGRRRRRRVSPVVGAVGNRARAGHRRRQRPRLPGHLLGTAAAERHQLLPHVAGHHRPNGRHARYADGDSLPSTR